MGIAEIVFFVVAAIAIAASLGVVLHPHPVYSALSLVVALFQIAVLFILLDAQMVAFLQIIVYAGAIMVLFLFVIMLLNVGREEAVASPSWRALMAAVGGTLGVELAWFFLRRAKPPAGSGRLEAGYGSVTALARTLFTDHVLSFELTSILLLVAIVGAVVLAKRHAAD
jgi:NADH-quinone oxidoreductase subunit J